jgi:hypothetical protein
VKETARGLVRRLEHAANERLLARSSYHFEGRRGLVRRSEWAIGIYEGPSPVDLRPADEPDNPVLSRHDVTDVPADFVADPFMLPGPTGWTMFFEVLNRASGRGEIGAATSPDGRRWHYAQLVLVEPFHLSYPYVFAADGERYMIPETADAGGVRLYVADSYPDRWRFVATLVEGHLFDASVFQHDDRWWMYCGTSPNLRNDYLRLFHAPELFGPWQEHPASPVVRADPRSARPAGRVVFDGARPIRFAQDCYHGYGRKVHAFEVVELTPTSYRERPLARSVLPTSREGWSAVGMHTLDAHRLADGRWLAVVDGRGPISEERGTRRSQARDR